MINISDLNSIANQSPEPTSHTNMHSKKFTRQVDSTSAIRAKMIVASGIIPSMKVSSLYQNIQKQAEPHNFLEMNYNKLFFKIFLHLYDNFVHHVL